MYAVELQTEGEHALATAENGQDNFYVWYTTLTHSGFGTIKWMLEKSAVENRDLTKRSVRRIERQTEGLIRKGLLDDRTENLKCSKNQEYVRIDNSTTGN